MAVIPAGTRFDAIRVNAQYLNKRSEFTNTNDPTYSIEDLANTIGAASVGPAGPGGPAGPAGADGPVGLTGLDWQGTWTSGSNYTTTDAVGYNGASWFCIADISGGIVAPNVDTTHWALLAAQGATGPAGATGAAGATGNAGPVGLTWQEAWVSGNSYGLTDAVIYDGSAYYCIATSPFSSTTAPNLDTTNWSLLVQKGDQGIQGIQGIQGVQGMQWQGVWVLNGYYSLNDAVFYDGSSYISTSVTPFNSTIVPSSDPANWSLVAQKGNDGASGTGGLSGESYVFVPGNLNSATDNGTDLKNKYAQAAALTPNGAALSATNRATVIVAPGNYDFASPFFMLYDYVDVVSLTGDQDIIVTTPSNAAIITIANDQYLKGVKVLANKKIQIGSNQSNLVIENCSAGDQSFGSGGTDPRGTFIKCTAGSYSFGYGNSTTSILTCIDCVAGPVSFGAGTNLTVSGTYTNCKADFGSFGSGTGVFSNADFTDCVCEGGGFGSGTGCDAGGTYKNCDSRDDSFGSGALDSKFTGRAYNCISGNNSFGGDDLMLQGVLISCILTDGTFKTISPGLGVTRLCIDGSFVENNQP